MGQKCRVRSMRTANTFPGSLWRPRRLDKGRSAQRQREIGGAQICKVKVSKIRRQPATLLRTWEERGCGCADEQVGKGKNEEVTWKAGHQKSGTIWIYCAVDSASCEWRNTHSYTQSGNFPFTCIGRASHSNISFSAANIYHEVIFLHR
jgi:hypothetical protein